MSLWGLCQDTLDQSGNGKRKSRLIFVDGLNLEKKNESRDVGAKECIQKQAPVQSPNSERNS